MAQGYKDFTSGAVLNAADLEDYCELQGIMRFASAAARTTALSGVLTEGLMCYLIDLNVIQAYSGSAWSTIGPVHGALTAWAPTLTQSGTVTKTTVGAYSRVGRWVIAYCTLSVTGAGSASNQISVSLPVTAATSNALAGTGYVIDASANAGAGGMYTGIASLAGTTLAVLYATSNSGQTAANLLIGSGSSTMTAALASGDAVVFQIQYEAAADA